MWVRADLKERAKNVLRKYYWIAFLVTLVASLLIGGVPNLSYRFSSGDFHTSPSGWNNPNADVPDYVSGIAGLLVGSVVAGVAFIFMLVGIAYTLFVSGPLETGLSRYFIEARQDRSDFANLFYAFRGGRYLSIVKAMGWRLLFSFLWSLLLIIPGIVKWRYSYGMIPYIMAENPGMDYRRAMRLSMDMTNGHKWEMFVLDLSFIGWYLLGFVACCVGVAFVSPYHYATIAELYAELKYRAVSAGIFPEDGQDGYVTSV